MSDGRFEIDTGRVERAIRGWPWVKNFILTGSAAAGARLATAYTVVESLRRILGTERVREYRYDVVARLEAGCPLQGLHGLVTNVWIANKTAEKRWRVRCCCGFRKPPIAVALGALATCYSLAFGVTPAV